jgi:flagellar biosynthesis/type III secretory pathway M-ring protein FliF/YscJ
MTAFMLPMAAVGTGVVVIVVAIAVVLIVLLVTVSMRGRQRRGAELRDQTRRELGEAHVRAGRAERDRDVAQEQAEQGIDRDG